MEARIIIKITWTLTIRAWQLLGSILNLFIMKHVVYLNINIPYQDVKKLNDVYKGEIVRFGTGNGFAIIGDDKVMERHKITQKRGNNEINDNEWRAAMAATYR